MKIFVHNEINKKYSEERLNILGMTGLEARRLRKDLKRLNNKWIKTTTIFGEKNKLSKMLMEDSKKSK